MRTPLPRCCCICRRWPTRSGDLHPQLTGFSADRAEIHQATGMISAQAGVTLVDALLLLRARAYSTNRTMLDISRDVLDRRERFYPDGGAGWRMSMAGGPRDRGQGSRQG